MTHSQNDTIWISPRATVGARVLLGRGVRIWGPVDIGPGTIIEDHVQIGHPSPQEVQIARIALGQIDAALPLEALDDFVIAPTVIGADSIIRSATVIYSGVTIGHHFDCTHGVCVREDCRFGSDCYITSAATHIRRSVNIGHHARLAGTICDRSTIGNYVSCLGHLMHTYRIPEAGHVESAPILDDYVVVGRQACVIGGVRLGSRSYIAAGAIVNTDVPANSLVVCNKGLILSERSPILAWRTGDSI